MPGRAAAVKRLEAAGRPAHLRRMDQLVPIDAEGNPELPAEFCAALLGARLEDFRADLRAGVVYSLVERGEGEDAGRLRLTLRRRGRERVLVVEAATGRVLSTS